MPLTFADIRFCVRCGQALESRAAYGRARPTCPACGHIHFLDPKVAVAVVVTRDAKILLVRRAVDPERGKWSLPAGFVDAGENPARAAEREAQEECGLQIRVTRLMDVLAREDPQEGADILIVYAAEPVGGDLRAGDDAAEACWFAPDDLPAALAFASTRRVLAQWARG